jgi:hypothetical protein
MTAVYSLFAFGRDRHISLTSLADGIVTVVASIILVQRVGLAGAPLGALAGVLLVGLPFNLRGLQRTASMDMRRLLAPLAPWLWRFGLTAAGSAALATIWTPDTVLELVGAAAGVGTAYLAVMTPLALRDPLGLYVRPRLSALARNKARGASSPAAPAPPAPAAAAPPGPPGAPPPTTFDLPGA